MPRNRVAPTRSAVTVRDVREISRDDYELALFWVRPQDVQPVKPKPKAKMAAAVAIILA
jgi:hypothetical protein